MSLVLDVGTRVKKSFISTIMLRKVISLSEPNFKRTHFFLCIFKGSRLAFLCTYNMRDNCLKTK